jgi:hypothetical protein
MNNKPPCLTDWVNRCGSYHLVDWKAWHDECARYARERHDELLRERERGEEPRGAA